MTADPCPPGWSHNPSAWRRRLPVLALALLGCGIATYLGLYQLNVLPTVWEPFFGQGSRVILKESSIAHLLPIPDALVGAFFYLLEAGADALGGEERWRSMPWAVLFFGLLAVSLAVGGMVLAICQPLLFGAFCTLCLTVTVCSLLILALGLNEIRAAVQYLRRETARGRSFWQALCGHGATRPTGAS